MHQGQPAPSTLGRLTRSTPWPISGEEEDLWFHVDGAYGALAAGTALVGDAFRGLDRADSVALDPHKWLFVPFDADCVLVRDAERLRAAFSLVPAYLPGR